MIYNFLNLFNMYAAFFYFLLVGALDLF